MKSNRIVTMAAVGMMIIAITAILLIVGLLGWLSLNPSVAVADLAATATTTLTATATASPAMTTPVLETNSASGTNSSGTPAPAATATHAAPTPATVPPTATRPAPTATHTTAPPATMAATSTFLPAPSSTATVALQQYSGAGDYQAYDYSGQMLAVINQARCDNGLTPLTLNEQLGAAALAHAIDMATNNFFSHTGSDGSDVSARVTATGYPWRLVGENLAGGPNDPARVHEMLMNSPGHRANILDPGYREFGLGVINREAAEYRWYWTEVFGATGSEPISCSDIGL